MWICLGRTASAEPLEPKIIPQCEKHRTIDGQTVCGWVVEQADGTVTLDRWKLVLRSDAELVKLRKDAALVESMRDELGLQVTALRSASENLKVGLETCEARRDEIFADWKTENRKRHEAELKPRIGGGAGWYVAAIVGALAGGYILADQL